MGAYMLMWATSFILLFFSVLAFWVAPSRWNLFLKYMFSTVSSLVKMSMSKYFGSFSLMMVSLFMMILFLNVSSLISYTFGETSHLAITLSLSLPFWFSLIMSGVVQDPQKMAASLLPSGAPSALNPFLILIETVSIGVRPLILALRLGANITAGHIVMFIIGGFLESAILSFSGSVIVCSLIQALYMVFEFGICFIQAYIFVLLLVLYSNDHPY
nr:TPA_asm: ATP synthase F0 subunit 6 [Pachydermia laevis]